MGVACQVMKDMFGSSEWRLGVDHPVVAKQWPQKSTERFLLRKLFHTAGEPEVAQAESAFQAGNERLCNLRDRFTWSGLDSCALSSGVPAALIWRWDT